MRTRNTRFATSLLLVTLLSAKAANKDLPQLQPIPTNQPFTFAILGDNRGDDSGDQPAAFRRILHAVNDAKPALAVNTGDMIYGGTTNEAVAREYWRRYHEAATLLKAPLFHIPGNHDIWNEMAARLYRELCGPPSFSFDYGRARFIGLDCETVPSRLGNTQFNWLRQQLQTAGQRIVFVFLHRPLFPVDGAIGSSMDALPSERDRLHELFAQHRRVIQGVFLGHEHMYHFHQRDGVPYYITGGGGAPLYVAPELGGFHHFLVARVDADKVTIELKKVGAPAAVRQAPRRVAPGEMLESWEQGRFWFAWNYSATTEITSSQASEGGRGLQFNFDLAQCPWPVLSLSLPAPWDFRNVESYAMDVFVPGALRGTYSLTAGVEGASKHEAPTARLKPGWNTVRTAVDPAWLPASDQRAVRGLGWSLSCDGTNATRGSVVFDNLRLNRRGGTPELLESWERPLHWRVADESVLAECAAKGATAGPRGLKLTFDFAQCQRPVLLARLNPPWNLTDVGALAVRVQVPDDQPGPISLTLGLRAKEAVFTSPPVCLQRGSNLVSVELAAAWLPPQVRAAAEQLEWTILSPDQRGRGSILLDDLRARE